MAKIDEAYRIAAPDDVLAEIEQRAIAVGAWCGDGITNWNDLDVCRESIAGDFVAPLLRLLTPLRLISMVQELRSYRAGDTDRG